MRIAVCDDNKVTLDFLCEEIGREFSKTKADFSLDVFENGADFLSQHEKTPFDIVFLDIDMPTINGFEIAERINKNNSSLIVFVTSHDELVYSSFKFQPFRFIRKNHITAELPETVKASAEKYIQRTAARNFEVRTSFGNVFLDLTLRKDLYHITLSEPTKAISSTASTSIRLSKSRSFLMTTPLFPSQNIKLKQLEINLGAICEV